jgi:hypothetical protein
MPSDSLPSEIQATPRFRDNFPGTAMDNTSANMAASARLEAQHRSWICLGCVAQALNFLIEDFANTREGKSEENERPLKRSKTDKTAKVGLLWIQVSWVGTCLHSRMKC